MTCHLIVSAYKTPKIVKSLMACTSVFYVLAAQLPKEIDVPSLQSCRIELLHADVDSGSVEDWKAFASKTYQNNVTFDPTTLFNI